MICDAEPVGESESIVWHWFVNWFQSSSNIMTEQAYRRDWWEGSRHVGFPPGELQKLEDFLDLGPECPEQSTASTSCDTGGEADLTGTGKSGKFKERGRAKTSALETGWKCEDIAPKSAVLYLQIYYVTMHCDTGHWELAPESQGWKMHEVAESVWRCMVI